MPYNRLIILVALHSGLFCAEADKKLPPLPSQPRPHIYDAGSGCLTVEEGWDIVNPDERIALQRLQSASDNKMKPSSLTKKLVQEARENIHLQTVIATLEPAAFTTDYKETLIKNGKNTVLTPKNYYQSLGIDPAKGTAMSHKEVMDHITLLRAQESLSSAEQVTLRQVMYPFKTSFGKQCYDAFITDRLQTFVTDFKASYSGGKMQLHAQFTQLLLAVHS
jgi:hypothetical protein